MPVLWLQVYVKMTWIKLFKRSPCLSVILNAGSHRRPHPAVGRKPQSRLGVPTWTRKWGRCWKKWPGRSIMPSYNKTARDATVMTPQKLSKRRRNRITWLFWTRPSLIKLFFTTSAVSVGTGAQKPLSEFLHRKLCSYGKKAWAVCGQ